MEKQKVRGAFLPRSTLLTSSQIEERQRLVSQRRLRLRKDMGLLREREKKLFAREFENLERLEQFEQQERAAASPPNLGTESGSDVVGSSVEQGFGEPSDPALSLVDLSSDWPVDGIPFDWSFSQILSSVDAATDKPPIP